MSLPMPISLIICDGWYKYEICRDGTILSYQNNRWGKSETPKILKPMTGKNGYHYVVLYGKRRLVHRLVCSISWPITKDKPMVNHKDGIRTNNHYTNLEWVSNSENLHHAYKILKIVRSDRGSFRGGGVFYDKKNKNWMAYTGSKKEREYHGRYSSKEEAMKAVMAHRKIRGMSVT